MSPTPTQELTSAIEASELCEALSDSGSKMRLLEMLQLKSWTLTCGTSSTFSQLPSWFMTLHDRLAAAHHAYMCCIIQRDVLTVRVQCRLCTGPFMGLGCFCTYRNVQYESSWTWELGHRETCGTLVFYSVVSRTRIYSTLYVYVYGTVNSLRSLARGCLP